MNNGHLSVENDFDALSNTTRKNNIEDTNYNNNNIGILLSFKNVLLL